MSRYMQIRVRIDSIYRHCLEDHFPNICRSLKEEGIIVGHTQMSLYRLVDEMEKLLFKEIKDPYFKAIFSNYKKRLFDIRKEIEENLASRRLDRLDQALYRLEDAIEDMERDLG